MVKAGKARYLGASSMQAWRFAKLQHVAERNGWTPFVSMQDQYNLINRGEELEMFGLLADQGVGSIRGARSPRGSSLGHGATGPRTGAPGARTASAVRCGSTPTRPSSTPSNASPKPVGCRWLRLR